MIRKIYFVLILNGVFLTFHSSAQTGQWTWMNGSNISGAAGVFGIQGTPAATNTPPAMYEVCDWQDTSGNLWLFGGLINFSERNDLWKYDPVSYEWTWVKGSGMSGNAATYGVQGVPSPLNNPGGRSWGAFSFVDNNNNLWMYGGIGYDGVGGYECLSDLWKYDINTNEWTWMQGPDSGTFSAMYGTKSVENAANSPGARCESDASWTDKNNNLWLFGGAIYAPQNGGWSLTGFGNDLWKYDMSTNNWAWMKGANTLNQVATYGTKGVAATNNVPSARGTYTKWIDGAGDLWMFSGYNFFQGNLNDVWKYHIAANQWTWMSGPNTIGDSGSATAVCNPAVSNIPASRYENRASAIDACGNFWTMGGEGGGNTPYNDLWKFNPVTLEWTWVSGDRTGNSVPVYGTEGVSAPANVPDGKMGAGGWMDKKGNFWVFGGMNALWNQMNDMWRYVPDTTCGACANVVPPPIAALQASDTIICTNDCISFTDHSINATSWMWTFTGGTPATSTDQNPSVVCYFNPGLFSVKLVATNAGGSDSITAVNYINTAASPPIPNITQYGDTLKCSIDTSYISYQWFDSTNIVNGATNSFYIAQHNGNFNVQVENKNGCKVAVGINVILNGLMNQETFNGFSLYPNPANNKLFVNCYMLPGKNMLIIYNMLGEICRQSEIQNPKSEIDVSYLPAGIYFVKIQRMNSNSFDNWTSRFVKE